MRLIILFIASTTLLYTMQLSAADKQQSHTIGWAVSGIHTCESAADHGHVCQVTMIRAASCDQAHRELARRDCCPDTRKCTYRDGKKVCRYGGKSIVYKPDNCSPQL